MKKYTIQCSECKIYRNIGKRGYFQAKKKSSLCGICSKKGEKHPLFKKPGFFLGRSHSEKSKLLMSESRKGIPKLPFSNEHKLKISNSKKGKKLTEKQILNMSERFTGTGNPFYGKHHSEKTKSNISIKKKIYTDECKYNVNFQRRHFNYWLKENKNGFEKYIGLFLEEFKKYISDKFSEEMNWGNYGKTTWHIDHIKPLSSFDLTNEDEVKKAWNYLNLRPLFWKDNLSKGSKILIY